MKETSTAGSCSRANAPQPRSRNQTRRRFVQALIPLALSLSLSGCIRSRVLITSEPSGAEVQWRGEHRGPTPIEIPFKWYWHYDYSLEKEGYEKVEILERLRTPPWFLMPVDLFAEMIPFPFSDRRERHYVLDPLEEDV